MHLPYDLDTCLELWLAWNKGVMPVRGGYFDQPRKWRRLVRLFNRIHNPILRQYQEEVSGGQPRRERRVASEDDEGFDDLIDTARRSFGDLWNGH